VEFKYAAHAGNGDIKVMIKTYYLLTKPGIIMGNLITTVAGFALACTTGIDLILFTKTLVGLGLVIASACVCNNYIDRHNDKKMERTKNRALVQGIISSKKALIFASILGATGLPILAFTVNYLTAFMAFVGFLVYVGMYTFLKTHTRYATLIGSISGAVPPVVGYVAVSNRLDIGALLLFLILVLWQMPHFYSIAVYSFEDYKKASIPVLPVVHGIHITKIHMILYIVAFMITTLLLTYYGYTGYAYLISAGVLSASWLILGIKGLSATNDIRWARKMFALSLVIIVALSLVITLTHL
jgi:protoheme IX farnesyltransferase